MCRTQYFQWEAVQAVDSVHVECASIIMRRTMVQSLSPQIYYFSLAHIFVSGMLISLHPYVKTTVLAYKIESARVVRKLVMLKKCTFVHTSKPAAPAACRQHRHLYSDHEGSGNASNTNFSAIIKNSVHIGDACRWKADTTSSVAASTMRYQICPHLCHPLISAVLRAWGQWLATVATVLHSTTVTSGHLNASDKMAAGIVGT